MKKIGSLRFENLLDVSVQHAEQVRLIRNHPEIRKYMYTDHVISPNEHQCWIEKLKEDKTLEVFVVFKADQLIGLVSVNKISYQHRTADWAFYIDPKELGGGVGVQIEYALLEYVFEDMGLQKLNCEVLSINPKVVKLHQKFGFQNEGFRRANIVKGKERVGVHLLGITATEWKLEKPKFKKIIKRYAD